MHAVLRAFLAVARPVGRTLQRRLEHEAGGHQGATLVLVLAGVLGLSGADTATVGASATELRHALHISNTDIGLLVAITSLVAAFASLPFGMLADRVRRTWTLAAAIVLWAAAMLWSASSANFHELLVARMFLGGVTAAAGPLVASLVGDAFDPAQRGRIYGIILAGELVGSGIGFTVTGDIATLSWRAAFVVLALPALVLAYAVARLPEPRRGGSIDTPHGPTDAQRLAAENALEPDPELVLEGDVARMGLIDATRHVLAVRTNVVLIASSACGYYFLAGVQTFGVEFAKDQYRVGQALANVLLLVIGSGAVLGVLAGGTVGDLLIKRRYLNGRILTATVAAAGATVLFGFGLFTRSLVPAVLYLMLAALLLSAQNPPLDAARLDVMPPALWGRAEGVRTLLRSLAQALAPLLFGAVSDVIFGGGRSGLQWTFAVMLVPLAASAYLLSRGLRTYPRDVATAAASSASAEAS